MRKIKYILFLLGTIVSATADGYQDSIELKENMSLHIEINNYFHKATYNISHPGSDAWLENGSYHATKKMPACLIILGVSLGTKQLQQFINNLDITTINDRKLSLETYWGTWTFLDKTPWNSSFGDTPYIIKPKDNLTFGQLLQYVGGTQQSKVTIEFSRGCAALAIRPYLPATSPSQYKIISLSD